MAYIYPEGWSCLSVKAPLLPRPNITCSVAQTVVFLLLPFPQWLCSLGLTMISCHDHATHRHPSLSLIFHFSPEELHHSSQFDPRTSWAELVPLFCVVVPVHHILFAIIIGLWAISPTSFWGIRAISSTYVIPRTILLYNWCLINACGENIWMIKGPIV